MMDRLHEILSNQHNRQLSWWEQRLCTEGRTTKEQVKFTLWLKGCVINDNQIRKLLVR